MNVAAVLCQANCIDTEQLRMAAQLLERAGDAVFVSHVEEDDISVYILNYEYGVRAFERLTVELIDR